MKLIYYLLECVLLTSTPTPTPTLNLPLTGMKKIVIIVVQCDKNYDVSMCACPVAPFVSLLALIQCCPPNGVFKLGKWSIAALLTDQTQNSCGGTISSFRHTHREEVAKKWRKQLPVVGLDQCVNPPCCLSMLRCSRSHTYTSRKPFRSTCLLPKTFHSQYRPPNGVFKLGKWSIAALLMQNLCWLLPQGSQRIQPPLV